MRFEWVREWLKISSSEELWGLSLECRGHTGFGLIHSALNPLERILSLWMTILVRVELLRQFAVKLGELVWLHLMHAGDQHVNRSIQELVNNVNLLTLQLRVK